jgi:hypothetical protein
MRESRIFQGIHLSSPPIKGGPLPLHKTPLKGEKSNIPREEHHLSFTPKGYTLVAS